MSTRSTVVLSYPPASSIWHLPMGVGYLAAILESRGHDVVQEYGYVKAVEHLLREHGGPGMARHLAVVRDPDSSVLDRYDARMAFETTTAGLGEGEGFAVERNNVKYDSKHFKGGVAELVGLLRRREDHVFHRYFTEVEVPRAVSLRPDLYGISVADERQLISGCVLASLVKEALPSTTVVLGGNYWSRVVDAFHDPLFAELFDHWDGVVHTEGFQAITQLADGVPLAGVAGLVWRDGDTVRVNGRAATPTPFEDLPTPVFAADARQWSPDFVPPLYTSSNCPMRCSFCSIAAGSDTFLARPRVMSAARIADHVMALGAHRFDVLDEFFTISRQLALGREFARRGYRATWQCYLTMNDKLGDPGVCRALADAGCAAVQLGLESLDPDVLRQEAKSWNHPRNYGRILKNLHDAGIQTHVFLIVGIPNEPINQNLRWLAFLEECGEHILTIKSGRYRLTRRAPDEQRANAGALPGIRASATDGQLLNLNRDQFSYTTNGLSRKRVEAVRDLLEEACRRHWAYQVTSTVPWWTNRGRYTLAELRDMARTLAAHRPAEQALPERRLRFALNKTASAIREECGTDTWFASYDDALRTSRELMGDLGSGAAALAVAR
ncbi:B12-binding domain-containing radical SAM protein [Saccharothrix australiensis]|uniref:Radical SAM family protein n=1 Tax=Saccharothrix australiensis TaxID=2072 RepID=A0A495W0M0_9PSEU|nr:radical SAM protein [Saccharothrix australiensis]RKT54557.1 radical SAM family protein [Saccharothrix australiensis]